MARVFTAPQVSDPSSLSSCCLVDVGLTAECTVETEAGKARHYHSFLQFGHSRMNENSFLIHMINY